MVGVGVLEVILVSDSSVCRGARRLELVISHRDHLLPSAIAINGAYYVGLLNPIM